MEFLKASIADLITLLVSSLQNSEGSGDGNSIKSCADSPPPIFTIFEGFTFKTFSKKTCKNENLELMSRKSKQKNRKKAFKAPAMKRRHFFKTKICQ